MRRITASFSAFRLWLLFTRIFAYRTYFFAESDQCTNAFEGLPLTAAQSGYFTRSGLSLNACASFCLQVKTHEVLYLGQRNLAWIKQPRIQARRQKVLNHVTIQKSDFDRIHARRDNIQVPQKQSPPVSVGNTTAWLLKILFSSKRSLKHENSLSAITCIPGKRTVLCLHLQQTQRWMYSAHCDRSQQFGEGNQSVLCSLPTKEV